MSNINKAVLKVAQSNPEFKKALQAELSKQAVPLGSFDEDQYNWDFAVEKLDDALAFAGRELGRNKDREPHVQITAIEAVATILGVAVKDIGDLRETGSQEALKAAQLLKASAVALDRLSTAIRKR
jgi:hypothetical protein